MRLLLAARVGRPLTEKIADRWGFRETVAFVAGYLADPRANGPGVLKTRCLDPDAAAPFLAATAPELDHLLIRQHVTDDDLIAWARDDKVAIEATESARYRVAAALLPPTEGLPELPSPPAEPTAEEEIATALETTRNRLPLDKAAKLARLDYELRGHTLCIRGTPEQIEILRGKEMTLEHLLPRRSGFSIRDIEYEEIPAPG